MKARSLFLSTCLLAGLASPARPQKPPFELPTLTTDQRWNRLEFHWVSLAAGAVAYAKAKGEGVEAFSHFLGKFFAPSWADTLSPAWCVACTGMGPPGRTSSSR